MLPLLRKNLWEIGNIILAHPVYPHPKKKKNPEFTMKKKERKKEGEKIIWFILP